MDIPNAEVVAFPVDATNVYAEVVEGVPYSPANPSVMPGGYAPMTSSIDEPAARQFLFNKGWPLGLQTTLINNLAKIPMRYFICDDSGSMMSADGNHVVGSGSQTKLVNCSRWTELTDALRFHVQLAKAARAPTGTRGCDVHVAHGLFHTLHAYFAFHASIHTFPPSLLLSHPNSSPLTYHSHPPPPQNSVFSTARPSPSASPITPERKPTSSVSPTNSTNLPMGVPPYVATYEKSSKRSCPWRVNYERMDRKWR